jgi:predicted secreted protein
MDFMPNRKILLQLIVFSLLGTLSVFAGDVANFVDLGFSEDGNTYMYGQFGVREGSQLPWAEMRIVNVRANDFVSNGRFNYTHTDTISAGQDGAGALYKLIARNSQAIEKYAVPFLRQGVPLYITLLNGQTDAAIDFRDFEKDVRYTAKIVPYTEGYGESLRSSFFVEISRTGADGVSRTFTAGTPGIKRNGIESYFIKKVLVAPDRSSMIFVIEMYSRNGAGAPDVRYMVETLKLP